MADTRSLDDIDSTVAGLAAQLDDFKSTAMARIGTRPTGDIEPTIRTTPKNGTLILNGQTVNRVDYPALWQWANDQGLVRANLFGSGNGSTTFVLPDMRGRILRGVAASGETTGTTTGADTHVISSAELPTHTHTISGGAHAGHKGATAPVPAGDDGLPDVWYGTDNQFGNFPGTHTHTVANAGSSSAMDMRQAGIAVNWLIWV